jgi:hypothetical protein
MADSSGATTIYLHDRRQARVDIVSKLQHVTAGVPLLLAGLARLRSDGSGEKLLALVEIGVAAAVLSAFVVEFRATRRQARDGHHGHHQPVGWFDIAASGMLFLEAWHQTHPGGKPIYVRPTFLAAVTTLAVGLAHGWISRFRKRRRYVTVDANGVRARFGPFRHMSFAWADVVAVRVHETTAEIETARGRRSIKLRRYANAAAVTDALLDGARLGGVEVAMPVTSVAP